MAYRGTVNSRTNQRWMLAEQASQFSSGEHSKAGAGPMLPPLSSQGAVQASKTPSGRSPSKAPRSPSKALPTSEKLSEAFREVEQLLRARPTMPIVADRQKEATSAVGGDAVTSPQPSMTKATSAPALLRQPTATKRLPPPPPPQVELPTEYDSDDEEVKKAKAERGPKRSVALKIAARRVLDSDPPPLPMARHKVQGAHGLEYHKVVDISAIQSSCEQLGGNISVEQMLGRRRQREEREQEQERVRREQEQSRWLHNSSARTLSWEERQEQVMLRRRQHRQEEAYRRLAATREARKLVKGAGLDGDLSPTMGALLRDMPSKLKEEEERDGV